VAQFIGSPSMNVLTGSLQRVDGKAWVEAHGARWPVASASSASDGHAVSYGVRPGDISISGAGQGIPAKVIVVEPTGAETELLLEVGGAQLIVVIHGRTQAKPDDIVGLEIDASKTHLFDGKTGKRLG